LQILAGPPISIMAPGPIPIQTILPGPILIQITRQGRRIIIQMPQGIPTPVHLLIMEIIAGLIPGIIVTVETDRIAVKQTITIIPNEFIPVVVIIMAEVKEAIMEVKETMGAVTAEAVFAPVVDLAGLHIPRAVVADTPLAAVAVVMAEADTDKLNRLY
jgi:hypothetical protein